MLDPKSRYIYLDALRPPVGYVLDCGIATTYSLDLMSLLMAPLSLAMLDLQGNQDTHQDPIALLEALRRATGKFFVFCQKGQIAVPKISQLLYSYLESMVIEVMPLNPQGVFHPKTWLLRFTSDDGPVIYRFLCLSRNLTFDRSWDTILTLEGEVGRRRYSKNRPLADFVKSLPSMGQNLIDPKVLSSIDLLTEEVMRVQFQAPDGFEDLAFWPMGISKYHKLPIRGPYKRILIVSPFLKDKLLEKLTSEGNDHWLISRPESLDDLEVETRNCFQKIFMLNDVMEEPEVLLETETGTELETSLTDSEESEPSGLHAKLYIAEEGWNARLWTGSANATNAAFFKHNVEFLVELSGKKSKIGIDSFLGQEGNGSKFRDLLRPYTPSQPGEKEVLLKQLEDRLDKIRQKLIQRHLKLVAKCVDQDVFELKLTSEAETFTWDYDITVLVWPITLKEINARSFIKSGALSDVTFAGLSSVALTSFIAFRLTIHSETLTVKKQFVLNIPLEGGPDNRDELILQNILSDKQRFLRYLLLLLNEGNNLAGFPPILTEAEGFRKGEAGSYLNDLPLLEELVRAYSRDPAKIKRIGKLFADLIKTQKGRKVLPEGFAELWQSFEQAQAIFEEDSLK